MKPGIQYKYRVRAFTKVKKKNKKKTVYGKYSETVSITIKKQETDTLTTKTIEYNKDYDDGLVNVQWGGRLFNDMDSHSPELALLTAALCATAGDDDSGDKAKDYYIAKAYNQLGLKTTLFNYPKRTTNFKDVDHKNTKVFDPIADKTDEHCFAIGYTDLYINNKKTHVVVITLRGTNSNVEKAGDWGAICNPNLANIKGRAVYNYWNDFSKKVIQGLDTFVDSNPSIQSGPVKILIGGHSLGGGAANILGARMNYEIYDQDNDELGAIKWDGPQSLDDIQVFTFGALNVFDSSLDRMEYEELQEDPCHPCSDYFRNIKNIFNDLDTYGPKGEGTSGYKPGLGGESYGRKYGTLELFKGKDYRKIFNKPDDKYANHSMQGYVRAMEDKAVPFWSEAYYSYIMSGRYWHDRKGEPDGYYTDEYHSDDPAFYLHDFDNNGVPELIAFNGCKYMSGRTNYVYTYECFILGIHTARKVCSGC